MTLAANAWMPTTDIYEQDGRLMVTNELPGCKKEDIVIARAQGDPSIPAERARKEHDQDRLERRSSRFCRRIPLDFDATLDQVAASYTDGCSRCEDPGPYDPLGLSAHQR